MILKEPIMRDEVKERIAEAAGVEAGQVKLEHPELAEHGDYSTNISLAMKGGRTVAEKIVQAIRQDDVIAKAEVAGPGFINIWVQSDAFVSELQRVITQDQDYGKSSVGRGRRVIVEYSSPNIAKRFGIGHLRSTIIGQALYNINRFSGYEVIGDNHLGDWGTQFGKLLYMISIKGEEFDIDRLEEWYVEFHRHPEWEEEGRKWFRKLEDGDTQARKWWQKCLEVSMAEFENIYTLLGVKIDNAFGESTYEKLMPQVIAEAKEKGIAVESEGAWVIEVPGIKTPLLLVKSDGGTTYATRDLATVKFRREKWDPDRVIYEVGGEQALHFQQVFGAAQMLGYVKDISSMIHTKHGLYLSPGGKKFSTRKGETVKLEEILEEAVSRAKELGCEDEATARMVGVGAVKYFDLMHNIQSDIVFDWEKMMALEGNSGPYLQYTFARTRSVLAKSGRAGERESVSSPEVLNDEERDILRWLYRFGEVVEEAGERLAPNLICNFLYELAQRYNTFYNKHSILQAGEEETVKFRLALTAGVGQVVENGLGLLGIEAPERM